MRVVLLGSTSLGQVDRWLLDCGFDVIDQGINDGNVLCLTQRKIMIVSC